MLLYLPNGIIEVLRRKAVPVHYNPDIVEWRKILSTPLLNDTFNLFNQ